MKVLCKKDFTFLNNITFISGKWYDAEYKSDDNIIVTWKLSDFIFPKNNEHFCSTKELRKLKLEKLLSS